MNDVFKEINVTREADILLARRTVEILSVKIDTMSFQEAISKISLFLSARNGLSGTVVSAQAGEGLHQIATINPEFVMTAQKDADFLEVLNRSDLNVADGVGLQFAAKILKLDIGPRITGVDLTRGLARLSSEKGYSIYFLGGAEGVAEKAAHRLKNSYTKLRIAGTYAGTPDEPGIVDRINESNADILLVAFGAPKQDKFIFSNKGKLNVKIAMGVGGTFDYIAGIVPYAPRWVRQIGQEWMYRLIKQPKRIKRIFIATILFPLAILKAKFLGKSK